MKRKIIPLFLIISLCCFYQAFAKGSNPFFKRSEKLPTVVVVTTGGTIAEKYDKKAGGLLPAVSGKDLLRAVPALKKLANIKVVNFSNIDSSQMTLQMWAKLSQKVNTILKDPNVSGVVVTHGTDTMAEGAYFLTLTLDSRKPVVFTGSMRAASDMSPDGPINLLNAVVEVLTPAARHWGVTLNFNGYINSALSVRKINTTHTNAFTSGSQGYLGYMVQNKIIVFHDPIKTWRFPIPKKIPKVYIISDFKGADSLINSAIHARVTGIIVQGVGAGNVHRSTYDALRKAIKKGIVVVITSQVPHGGVFPVYGIKGGGQSLEEIGAILSYKLRAAKARILLSLALPYVKGDRQKLKTYFQQ